VVANQELIKIISEQLRARGSEVSFEWVRGHAGHILNEKADELATKAARSNNLKN
jgi:ribonuclease HI